MTVDFRAVGDGGVPILDLKPADVSLKIGGRTRVVQSLELVRYGGGRVAADGTAIAPLAPPFASNHPEDRGRNVILMLEDESIPSGREQAVKDAVGALLDNLSGRDTVSLLTISRGKFDLGPTTQHDGIRTVLGKFVSRAPRSETAEDTACRTQRALGAILSVMASLSGSTRTTIVFISGGLAPPVASDPIVSKVFVSGSAACEIRRNIFDDISAAASRTSADLYTAYLPPDVQSATTAAADTGVETLAGAAGNALIRLSSTVKAEMARVARETSAYYLASFESEAADRTGSAVRVELRVDRNNAKIRARSELTIAKGTGTPAGTKAPSARDLLRVATMYHDLSIRAVACPARDASDRDLKVVVVFEPFDAQVPFASAAVGLFDDKGKLVVQWTADSNDLRARPVLSGFTVRPGMYRMRVAATDGSGRTGTVDQSLAVELGKGDGPVQMSALVLGVARGQAFAPQLMFESETGALGSFEVYGAPQTSTVTAAVEIAASPSGPVVARAPARVGAPRSDGRRMALAAIPLGSLPAGDHLVRVVVSVDGKPVGSVTRTLRKAVK